MNQNFDQIFSVIKEVEDTNSNKLSELKNNLKEKTKDLRNNYNQKREVEIEEIDKKNEEQYLSAKEASILNHEKWNTEVKTNIEELRGLYSKNKQEALDFLMKGLK
ncbi:MAG: hypothetical protein GY817_01360 [bacterium]|nr:hypothetical protein [bacterium]